MVRMYEDNGKLHTGIVTYGACITVKVATRNYVGKTLEFSIYEDINWAIDPKKNETIKIPIDNQGKGEAEFMVPTAWEAGHKDACKARYFYLEHDGDEFPRSFYIKTKGKEENEVESKPRVRALMLKVSTTLELDEKLERDNAVILHEELEYIQSNSTKNKEIIFPLLTKPRNDIGKKWGKNFYWADKQGGNMASFNSTRKTNRCGNWQRMHAARDLYTNSFTPVVAICDGEVLRVDKFYMKTDQITILHKTDDGREFIIRYGELAPNRIKLKKGDKVKQKQVLGVTGKLLKKNNTPVLKLGGTIVFMLHFECYTGALGYNLTESLTNCEKPFTRRSDLVDPIDILTEGYNNTFNEGQRNNEERVAPKTLRTSEKGIQFIKKWESFKSKAYNDSEGYCTIGYGHLIEKKKCENITIPTEFKNGITEAKAMELFKNRLVDFENIIHNQVKVNLYQYEFDALVSLIFNIGSFSSCPELKTNLDNANYEFTANEFKDITNGGTPGLIKRRNAEIKMFKNNVYDSTH